MEVWATDNGGKPDDNGQDGLRLGPVLTYYVQNRLRREGFLARVATPMPCITC